MLLTFAESDRKQSSDAGVFCFVIAHSYQQHQDLWQWHFRTRGAYLWFYVHRNLGYLPTYPFRISVLLMEWAPLRGCLTEFASCLGRYCSECFVYGNTNAYGYLGKNFTAICSWEGMGMWGYRMRLWNVENSYCSWQVDVCVGLLFERTRTQGLELLQQCIMRWQARRKTANTCVHFD